MIFVKLRPPPLSHETSYDEQWSDMTKSAYSQGFSRKNNEANWLQKLWITNLNIIAVMKTVINISTRNAN